MPDIAEHEDRFGFPPNHPPMTSFLGVPIMTRGEVFGNLYLTDKQSGEVFTDLDEQLVMGLAAAAGVVIRQRSLYGQVERRDAAFTAINEMVSAAARRARGRARSLMGRDGGPHATRARRRRAPSRPRALYRQPP